MKRDARRFMCGATGKRIFSAPLIKQSKEFHIAGSSRGRPKVAIHQNAVALIILFYRLVREPIFQKIKVN